MELAGEISVLKEKIRKLGQWELARMQAEVSLRESEDKYRSLVETTTDWVWAIDTEGCHTYSNPAILQLLGYRVSEVVGSSAFPLMHPEDEQPIRDMIKHCIQQKVGWQNFSIRLMHKDGSIRSFESTASPIVNADGQIAGFSGINRDITERKKAHDELEQCVADRTEELMRVNERDRMSMKGVSTQNSLAISIAMQEPSERLSVGLSLLVPLPAVAISIAMQGPPEQIPVGLSLTVPHATVSVATGVTGA
ncbi:PAS domain S-box protein [Patescibacteria group bacterium]|nr:PAS domain S-box protein [Patescibacteria group bacterium]